MRWKTTIPRLSITSSASRTGRGIEKVLIRHQSAGSAQLVP